MDTTNIHTIGILGAGKVGTVLARLALAAGYRVAVASSGPADRIELSVDVLAPGAVASTVDSVVDSADVIVLAVPAHRFRHLPSDLFDGKILVDAMNYWPDTDGEDPELGAAADGSSVVVQAHFPGARVVKSLNQLGYHELDELRRPHGSPDRIAVGAAGNDRLAVRAEGRVVVNAGGHVSPVGGRKGFLCERLEVEHAEGVLGGREVLRKGGEGAGGEETQEFPAGRRHGRSLYRSPDHSR